MLKENKLDWYFRENILASRDSICNLLKQKSYTLDRLLAEVTGIQLWKLVEIFRETEHWRNFLIALLNIPPTAWKDRELMAENAKEAFTPKEKATIRDIHWRMITEGRHSPILQLM